MDRRRTTVFNTILKRRYQRQGQQGAIKPPRNNEKYARVSNTVVYRDFQTIRWENVVKNKRRCSTLKRRVRVVYGLCKLH